MNWNWYDVFLKAIDISMETINKKIEFFTNQMWYEKANTNGLNYGMAQ